MSKSNYRLLVALAAVGALAEGCAADATGDALTTASEALGTPTPVPICSATTDIYVSDAITFGPNNGGIIHVDPSTGRRTTLSENNNPVGAPPFESPNAIAIEADGNLVVADSWSAGVFGIPGVVRVDPVTGVRSVVSNSSSPVMAPSFVEPTGIAVEASGQILVVDDGAFPNGGVIRVDPVTGTRTTLSRNGAPAGGARFETPYDVAVAANGDIYVVDVGNLTTTGKVIRVDPVTGARTLVSNNTNPATGPSFVWPWGIALDKAGSILISDMQAFGGTGGIIRVDPVTGARTRVSQNAAPTGGPSFGAPADLVVEDCGAILITDTVADAVFRVDPATGVRTLVSDNVTPAGLPDFAWSYGIAVKHAPPFQVPPHGGGAGGGTGAGGAPPDDDHHPGND